MQQPFTPRVLNIKPRRAPVALLLSVFFPGLGQMYNVQEVSIGHATGTSETNYYDFSHKFTTVNLSAGLGFKF